MYMYVDESGAATEERQMLYFGYTSLLILRYHGMACKSSSIWQFHTMPCDKTGIGYRSDRLFAAPLLGRGMDNVIKTYHATDVNNAT